MTFAELLVQVRELLQSKGRVSYRALKLQFDLDDDYLEGLKDELIEAERVAADEGGKVLVWVGNSSLESRVQGLASKGQSLGSSVQGLASKDQSPTPSLQTLDSRPSDSRLDAAERRQLTVMFCDLVGSTALSARLDPEEYHEVVRAYQESCTEVIRRYDGHIAQHLGDGLLVYFGYPAAHEDDAQRAVRAGLGIVEKLYTLSAPSPVPTGEGRGEGRLQVRIGIHTGPVVIGDIGSSEKREILALGETPNLAARIQGQANPDEVMISAATYRLIEGLFACEDRGQPDLKGISTPLTLYRVIKEGEAQSRFEVVVRRGLTPLVGREHEYGLLRERWERTKQGEGQVVLLSGEPGIGKSRLVEALKESVEKEGTPCLELRCSPYHQNSALYPVIEHVQRVLEFQQEDAPEEKLRKLEAALVGAYGRTPLQTEVVSLFAALLSLPHPEDYPPLSFSPQKQKEKTYEALVAWLYAEAKQQAVVYAWEDLHWADPSTLELLALFLNQVPTTRLLIVLTFRPEFIPPWGSHSYLSQLTLSRLGRSHVEVMVEKVTGGKALPKEVVQQIVSRTDGVPLFVEELTKSVVEAGLPQEEVDRSVGARHAVPLQALGIPATLQDALMARLDRLGPAKEIAQVGATIGREFNYDVLHAVSPLNEDTLQRGLKQLVEAELVFQNGVSPQARYLFKHALIQETAYQSLLKSRRQQLHHQVAQVLEEQFPQTVAAQPELAAYHYTEAGLIAQAIPYWQRAGERATRRSAYAEAISHLTKGLELLTTLPDTPERAQQELTLQLALGAPLIATKGYTAPEVGKAYTRALELCRQIGETPQLFSVLGGLAIFYGTQGEIRTARELEEQRMRLAQSVQDPVLLLEAYHMLGNVLVWFGEFASAQAHLEQSITLYDSLPKQYSSHLYLHDPKVHCLSYTAWALWFLGYPDQALERISKAFTLAQEFPQSYTQAWVLLPAAHLHQYRREGQLIQERAEAAITLSTNLGFPAILAMGTSLKGWALAEQGQGAEGIAQLREGIAAWSARFGIGRPHLVALLAEAYGKVGQAEEGLTVLTEALATVDGTGERMYEAELYRLKGELTLAQSSVQRLGSSVKKSGKTKVKSGKLQVPSTQHLTPNTQEAEECFLKAIEVARKQQAKSLELRATVSLARLWQQQGKHREARNTLSEIYNWFTEGFDTKDLQEAKILLEELQR